MPLSGVIATTEYPSEPRYRDRRAPQDRPSKPEAPLPPGPPAHDSGDVYDAAYYSRRFKTDLSQLHVFDGAEEPSPDADGDSAMIDFFGHLSLLLVAVRDGDIRRAQAAADALELDAMAERNVGRRPAGSAALLGDLVATLGAAGLRDDGAARLAPAAVVERDPYADEGEDGGAAYETLTQYLDREADAA
jgi:hypothetical protein